MTAIEPERLARGFIKFDRADMKKSGEFEPKRLAAAPAQISSDKRSSVLTSESVLSWEARDSPLRKTTADVNPSKKPTTTYSSAVARARPLCLLGDAKVERRGPGSSRRADPPSRASGHLVKFFLLDSPVLPLYRPQVVPAPHTTSREVFPPMIETHHLSRSYGPKLALSDLTLRVEPGEILGFLGPNGAGKSTTVKILTGMIRPTSGRASVAGFDIVEQPIEAKKKFGYVPESAAIYDGLTAAEYLELVACLHHLDANVAAARRHELLELFDLLDVQDQRLTEFSKGMRQKVLLASALLHRPDVLFLDEPLDGLDANAALVVKEVLKQLAAQGKTILFCSHILDVVERICTRIVIINNGQQIANGTSAEIRESTGTASLEQAFSKLTGVRDVGQVAAEFLAALEKA